MPNLSKALLSLSFSQIFLLAIGIVGIRWILRGFYRVYLHPLRRYPGPTLSAFTRIPFLIASYRGRLPEYVGRIHEKYGDIVRVSPDEITFFDPDAWRDIHGYGTKESRKSIGSVPPKHWPFYPKSVNGVEPIITDEDIDEHARARRIFAPAFSDRALTKQAPLFTKYADKLVNKLREGNTDGNKWDIVRMYNYTTFDVMADLTFGESMHMLENAEYDPWVKIMFQSVKSTGRLQLLYNHYPVVGSLVRKFLDRYMAKVAYENFEYASTRVTKRLEKGRATKGVDLWDLIFQQEDKGKGGLSRAQMDSNSNLFMIAGTETTATILSGTTYLLLQTPEIMKKLISEIRGTFASSSDISLEVLQGLPYLNAVIKEAFRHYPPVPAALPHKTPKDGSTICGEYIPPNTIVSVYQKAIYSSPKLFRDPKEFVPERWLGDERYANDARGVLQPFSVGARDCLGKNMAYHEFRLLLSKILYNFNLEMLPESQGWIERQAAYGLWEKIPLMVKVTPVGDM